jgi:hypothetical protein
MKCGIVPPVTVSGGPEIIQSFDYNECDNYDPFRDPSPLFKMGRVERMRFSGASDSINQFLTVRAVPESDPNHLEVTVHYAAANFVPFSSDAVAGWTCRPPTFLGQLRCGWK